MNILHWFTGVVEDIADPMQMGRVRVRCMNYHSADTTDIPTETLPWAMCIMPVTSAGMSGIGQSATGLMPGSWVFGFFRDGNEKQDPVILGSFASMSSPSAGGSFADPNGFYPNSFGADMPSGATYAGYGANQLDSGITSAYNSSHMPSVYDNPSVPVALNGSIESVIAIATSQVGVRETGGGTGPDIRKYWSASYASGNGGPWCATFIAWCIQQSKILPDNVRPKTASCFRDTQNGFEGWARKNSNNAFLRMSPKNITRGELVIFSFSHIGIALSNSDISGNFKTIEGNTNAAGSREGDGVYEKTRNIRVVRSAIAIR
jgi:cell wall-associated NlpC family hydrolase